MDCSLYAQLVPVTTSFVADGRVLLLCSKGLQPRFSNRQRKEGVQKGVMTSQPSTLISPRQVPPWNNK